MSIPIFKDEYVFINTKFIPQGSVLFSVYIITLRANTKL